MLENTNEASPSEATTAAPKKRRGFALLTPEKQREIASLGGKAAHAKGVAHEFDSEEARVAGSKGGKAARAKRATVTP